MVKILKLVDHHTKINLFELETITGERVFTFSQNGGCEVIGYNRLKEIHEKIGKALESEKDYKDFQALYNTQPVETYDEWVKRNEKAKRTGE